MIQTNRYLDMGPGGRRCPCCWPLKYKDRRKRWRSAKRKADRAAMKEAEAQMEDQWAELQEAQQMMDAFAHEENQYYEEYLRYEDYKEFDEPYVEDLYDDEYEHFFPIDSYDDLDHEPIKRRGIAMDWPYGAIQSVEELREHSFVFVASRRFRMVEPPQSVLSMKISALIDYNVLQLNHCNDWFCFADKKMAEEYAGVGGL